MADFLHRRAAEDAAERLAGIMRQFPLAVDLSSRGGVFAQALAGSDAAARVDRLIEADFLSAATHLVLDEEALPFATESLDLAVSLLSLHSINDLVGALIQIRQALKPDGLFLGALFGGETLKELRQALLQAEDEVTGGAGPRVSPFADALDGASLLQRAGFALPVSDIDRVTVRYSHPLKLMADLRAMGETNVLFDRPRRALTRAVLARTSDIYAERFSLPDGRVTATFDIITLTGWAPADSQQQPLRPGSAKMRLADALGVAEGKLERE